MVKKRNFCWKAILSVVTAVTVTVTSVTFPVFAKAEQMGGNIQTELFVSPNGNDSTANGSYENPFGSLEAAKQAVRKVNKDMTGDIVVFVAEGDYYVDQTTLFTEEDSASNGYKIIYRNLNDIGSARFIGGRKVNTAWNKVERTGIDADLPAAAEGNVYKTNVGTNHNFNTLYVNGKRATLARTQNLDQYEGFEAALTPYMRSDGGGVGDLIYKAGDLDKESIDGIINASNRGDLNASIYMWDGGYWDWMTDTIPISSIDTANRKLNFKTKHGHPEIYRPKYATRSDARYFIQGNLGFLDAPDEYYYNNKTGDLYYYPESFNMEGQNVIIPTVKEIIRIEGTSRDSMVSGIEFSGFTFTDTDTSDWYTYGWNYNDAGDGLKFYPEEATGSTQPSYCEQTERSEFQYGNITLKNTNSITISKCHITNTGMFGINLYLANKNTVIKDSLINNTGHGGINIDGGYPGVAGDENGDGYSRDNTVTNTIIHDIGELIGQASGLTVQQSGYNTFSNLEVYNSPRRGIFITAGHSRNPNTAFPNGDKDFNIMTDMYSHHNTFEYIYIHDCQQDGGDDGAFFGCYLYKGKDHKPNYINQMILDSTGGNPTMTDLGPNNMNLDMGCSGLELSNVKSTNPMNFNMEVNTILQYGDEIKFDNTNIDYGTLKNQINEFDDSKMEYDKIGVTADFPKEYLKESKTSEEYEDIWFEEDFEQSLDWNKWTFDGVEPQITTQWMSEGPLAGRQGLELKTNSALTRKFKTPLHKTISVKMFDRQSDNLAKYDSGRKNSGRATSFATAENNEFSVGIGVDWNNMDTYSIQSGTPTISTSNLFNVSGSAVTVSGAAVSTLGVTTIKTEVPRTFGWHEFTFDFTKQNVVKLFIDGKEVGEYAMNGFDNVKLSCERGITYYDQFAIHGGIEADAPDAVIPPLPPAYDSSNDNKTLLSIDMESLATDLSNWTSGGNGTPVVTYEKEANNANNKIARIEIGDNEIQFGKDKTDWKNYMMNLKWKFDDWGTTDVLGGAYDNFTIKVMTTTSNKPNIPYSYQVIFRRNKNGNGEFSAGVPYFEIMKRNSGDVSLGTVPLPDNFDLAAWHELQIQTFDGNVGFVLDGNKMLSVKDGSYTYGGISMGGINANVYVDDLTLISNPQNVTYPVNFGLENITIKGNFNPDYFNYYTQIMDTTQPIKLTEFPKVQNGGKVTVALNGEEITTIPAELKLKKGMNRLTFEEETVAGTRTYTIMIDKSTAVTKIEPLSKVTTTVGITPTLPNSVLVTFEDGTTEDVAIHWNMIEPKLYKKTGSFIATGSLLEFGNKVCTEVNVDGLVSIGSLPPITMEAGATITLPTSIDAVFTTGTKSLPLQFKAMEPTLYKQPGIIYAIAEIDGIHVTALLKIEKTKKPENGDTYRPNTPSKEEVYTLVLSAKKLTLEVGDSISLIATIEPLGASNKKITWTTSNPNVATVNKGLVTAVSNGNATITASTNDKSVSCMVTVSTDIKETNEPKEVKVTKVTVKPSLVLGKGKTTTLKASVSPSTATNKKLAFTSSNKKVATVDKNGKIKAIKAGTATITVTSSNKKKAVCKVVVPGVTLKKSSISLKVKDTATIQIKSTTLAKDKVASYKSSNSKIATVSKTGKVTGKKTGTTIIAVTMKSGAKATYKVKVMK